MEKNENKKEIIENWIDFFQKLTITNIFHQVSSELGYYPIESKIFKSEVNIANRSNISLRFKDCIFEKNSSISNIANSKEIHFWECQFYKQFDIQNCSIDSLDITRTKAHNIRLINNNIRSTRLLLKELSCVQIFGGIHEKLNINNPTPDILKQEENNYNSILISSNFFAGELNISLCTANSILFTGEALQTKINVSNIKVQNITFFKFFIKDGVNLNNIESIQNSNSEFNFLEAYMGESVFHNINFNNFKTNIIRKSFLSDSIFNHVEFPKKISIYSDSEIANNDFDLVIENKELIEVYRQLKIASKRNDDNISAQRFYGLELTKRSKSLKYKTNFDEKIIIIFSKLTSNFGQSISRPFLLLIVGHFIFIIMLLATNNIKGYEFTFSVYNTTPDSNFKIIKEYFKLISPIYEFVSINKWGLLIESIMKIWNSYMIYNFIRASRRFIK